MIFWQRNRGVRGLMWRLEIESIYILTVIRRTSEHRCERMWKSVLSPTLGCYLKIEDYLPFIRSGADDSQSVPATDWISVTCM